MRIVSRGTVAESEKDEPQQSNCFPSISVLPAGRWLCGFRKAAYKKGSVGQKALITWSDDEGRSWHDPVDPFVAPAINGKPGTFHSVYPTALGGAEVLAALYWIDYSNPALPVFNEETEGLLDAEIFLSLSKDNGKSWSEPWLMETAPFKQPTPITGPVLIMPDGRWVGQFELNNSYYDTSVWRHSSVMMFSKDQGKTWAEYSIASNDSDNKVFYWDQRPSVLKNGTLLDFFWTYDNQASAYLDIHARESLDSGRTWSAMWDTGVPGQPAPPVSLPDGRIVMVYVDRAGSPIVKVRVSGDNGRTWPDGSEATIFQSEVDQQTRQKRRMQDAWSEMGTFSVGLPTTTCLQDGDVLVCYYAGSKANHTRIEWVRIGFD